MLILLKTNKGRNFLGDFNGIFLFYLLLTYVFQVSFRSIKKLCLNCHNYNMTKKVSNKYLG